jgi:hypothetical protein
MRFPTGRGQNHQQKAVGSQLQEEGEGQAGARKARGEEKAREAQKGTGADQAGQGPQPSTAANNSQQ